MITPKTTDDAIVIGAGADSRRESVSGQSKNPKNSLVGKVQS